LFARSNNSLLRLARGIDRSFQEEKEQTSLVDVEIDDLTSSLQIIFIRFLFVLSFITILLEFTHVMHGNKESLCGIS